MVLSKINEYRYSIIVFTISLHRFRQLYHPRGGTRLWRQRCVSISTTATFVAEKESQSATVPMEKEDQEPKAGETGTVRRKKDVHCAPVQVRRSEKTSECHLEQWFQGSPGVLDPRECSRKRPAERTKLKGRDVTREFSVCTGQIFQPVFPVVFRNFPLIPLCSFDSTLGVPPPVLSPNVTQGTFFP